MKSLKPITCRKDCLESIWHARILISSASDDDAAGLSKLKQALKHLIDSKACLEAAIDLHKSGQ